MKAARGIVHLLMRRDDENYSVACGTIFNNIDAGVTNRAFVTCGWCQREMSKLSPPDESRQFRLETPRASRDN